jgi:subtilisin family serine protease
MTLKGLLALAGAVILVGCGEDGGPSKKKFPVQQKGCAATAIEGEYLVKWTTGKITKEYGLDDESFRDGFVTENLEQIEFVEPNRQIRLNSRKGFQPNFTLPPSQGQGEVDNWQIENVEAHEVWQQGHRGDGVVVAVIDSQVDIDHDQLRNRILVNAGESGPDDRGGDKSDNGIDDDGNGYVDDYKGYNFVIEAGYRAPAASHGTHVAGIIAAEHFDTSTGYRSYAQGIAPEAKILPLAFIGEETGSLDDAMAAMDYAMMAGVDIVNASWGARNFCSDFMRLKIREMGDKGILFVSASGNEGLDVDVVKYSPAGFNLPLQITVGATGSFDFTTSFSNVGGSNVHLFAPGEDIGSTYPPSFKSQCRNPLPGNYCRETGTSMSTPLVAGAAALLKSAFANTSARELKRALMEGSDFDRNYRNASQGKLNVKKAYQQLGGSLD